MKKMFMAVLFALVSVNAMAADCAKGKIEFSKYNENDTFEPPRVSWRVFYL
ncbi:Shiga toxin subunit B, partial [Escherichia coli]|nr:Shiga toxin subunit B [Escherichia coli]EJZ2139507.1 Shiga toxin subunit B [Escherichia coli]